MVFPACGVLSALVEDRPCNDSMDQVAPHAEGAAGANEVASRRKATQDDRVHLPRSDDDLEHPGAGQVAARIALVVMVSALLSVQDLCLHRVVLLLRQVSGLPECGQSLKAF